MHQPAILIIDDNQEILLSLRLLLKGSFKDLTVCADPLKIQELFSRKKFDIVILDMNFTRDADSGEEGFLYLGQLKALNPAVKVILITAYGDVDKAVRAIKAGAYDFILKPWQNEKVLAVVESATGSSLIAELPPSESGFHGLCYNSTAMQKVVQQIKQVAPTEANVLILGENGTGKEVVARAIWQESRRAHQPFTSVDLGSLSQNLLESELFGHVRGAFTDAKTERIGCFEAADKGTIFLDEIGNLPLSGQSKLLTAIEKKEICRLGSTKPLRFDARILAATNANLLKLVENGEFRRDLYYRLNTVVIQLPPLRERQEDILLLADSFLAEYAIKYQKKCLLDDETVRHFLTTYSWPGNIRELKHAMERAVILNTDGSVTISECGLEELDARENTLTLTLEEREREQVVAIMKKAQGNISQAARELGLTRASLYRRLEKFGLN